MLNIRGKRTTGGTANNNETVFLPSIVTDPAARQSVTDHMANVRTYLAWIRTGITVIALGFVVAKFGLIIKELVPNAPSTTYHFSTTVGIILVIAGGFMQLMALRSFLNNKKSIEEGIFRPSTAGEIITGLISFLIAILLIIYMLLTL